MIGYLEGIVKHAQIGKIILFSGGIGFTVHTPNSISFLTGQKTELYIHTHLRDDNLSLFGFSSATDLDLFELLISISGVGPKIGLAIFSSARAENIKQAIGESNLIFFTSISGVGKKTAQRIILDLKSKINKGDVNMESLQGNSELVNSLTALGFQKSEINSIISKVDSSADLAVQIRQSLKLLNS
jgi:holliday junction DNA helicase RuvA